MHSRLARCRPSATRRSATCGARAAPGDLVFVGNPGHGSSNLYHCTADDAGGVHSNSSINNRAFALLVDGETVSLKDDGTPFANPVTVTGIGITKAAHIFWRANSEYNGPASNFARQRRFAPHGLHMTWSASTSASS